MKLLRLRPSPPPQKLKNFLGFRGSSAFSFFFIPLFWFLLGFPKFFGVHFSQTLVALNRNLWRARFRDFPLLARSFLLRGFGFGKRLFLFAFGRLNFLNLPCVLPEKLYLLLVRVGVHDFFPSLDFVERRLGDVNKSAVEKRFEVTEEKREKECADVCAVNVG